MYSSITNRIWVHNFHFLTSGAAKKNFFFSIFVSNSDHIPMKNWEQERNFFTNICAKENQTKCCQNGFVVKATKNYIFFIKTKFLIFMLRVMHLDNVEISGHFHIHSLFFCPRTWIKKKRQEQRRKKKTWKWKCSLKYCRLASASCLPPVISLNLSA